MRIRLTATLYSVLRTLLVAGAMVVATQSTVHAQKKEPPKPTKEEIAQQFKMGATNYLRGKYADALMDLQPLAQNGHATAQYFLSIMYARGQGVPKVHDESVKWLIKSANGGNATAQFKLGTLYYDGVSISSDWMKPTEKAVYWYTKAAKQNHPKAQYFLAQMYNDGQGVPFKDKDIHALNWYTKSAENGYADAQIKLATLYEHGDGVDYDAQYAYMWYYVASQSKHAPENIAEKLTELSDYMDEDELKQAKRFGKECIVRYFRNCHQKSQ